MQTGTKRHSGLDNDINVIGVRGRFFPWWAHHNIFSDGCSVEKPFPLFFPVVGNPYDIGYMCARVRPQGTAYLHNCNMFAVDSKQNPTICEVASFWNQLAGGLVEDFHSVDKAHQGRCNSLFVKGIGFDGNPSRSGRELLRYNKDLNFGGDVRHQLNGNREDTQALDWFIQ